ARRTREDLMSFLRSIVVLLLAIGAGVAVLLVISQEPFADSKFEFQQDREHIGVLREFPYPALATPQTRFLLVDAGKHGASATAKGLEGKTVRLRGSLIQRGPDSMLELVTGTVQSNPETPPTPPETATDIGPAVLVGEIVDSKCFFGVMNPGNGKVHRDCAANCIRGGIPPAFLVRDAAGNARVFLLTGSDGRALHQEVLDLVAEPIRITGRISRLGTQDFLRAEPETFQRAAAQP
ncbi:MAG: hypothetical protein ABI823_21935, partial [Bryobacteraceae bacterium]